MDIFNTIPLAEIFGASHLIGLSLAVGGVFVADLIAFKSLLGSKQTLAQALPLLEILHTSIAIGLFILLFSGTAILFERFNAISDVPGKVWVKLGLVTLLVGNATFIQRKIIPLLEKSLENTTPGTSVITTLKSKQRFTLAICSSLSSLGWAGAFLLGTISIFKTMSAGDITSLLILLWLGLFLFTLTLLDQQASAKRRQQVFARDPRLA